MATMTIDERPPMAGESLRDEFQIDQLVALFQAAEGLERATLANEYATWLYRCYEDVLTIRDVEAANMFATGIPRAVIAEALGVDRTRTYQIEKRAKESGRAARRVVQKLREVVVLHRPGSLE